MPSITIPYNYQPRSYHRRIYAAMQRGVKHFCLVMHRRSGKTEGLVAFMPQPMLRRKGNYVHVFPLLQQAREVIWDGIGHDGQRYLDHFPRALQYGDPNKSELKVTLRDPAALQDAGSTYQLKGTDKNINALVGGGAVWINWDEYPLQNPLAREYARPILAENDGVEVLPYTPRGENHGYHLFNYANSAPDWHVEYLTVDETLRDAPGEQGGPVITQEAIEAHRKEMIAGGRDQSDADAIIEQEYYLSWHAPIPGSIYGEVLRAVEKDGRIRQVFWDPTLPTYTAWDLGRNDLNAIWFFQIAGHEVRFIDYMVGARVALAPTPEEPDSWITRVRAKPYIYDHSKLSSPLTQSKYEVHYGPHDLEVHEYSTNTTRTRTALHHGLRFTVLDHPGPGGLQDGIEATRRLLRRSVFDAEKCRDGLSALRHYHRAWDAEKQTYHAEPVKDWSTHGADALRYAAIGLRGAEPPPQLGPPPGSFAEARKRAIKATQPTGSRYARTGGR